MVLADILPSHREGRGEGDLYLLRRREGGEDIVGDLFPRIISYAARRGGEKGREKERRFSVNSSLISSARRGGSFFSERGGLSLL